MDRPGVVDDDVAGVQRGSHSLGIDQTHQSLFGKYRHGEVADYSFWSGDVGLETIGELEKSLQSGSIPQQ
jgi:hypothetical protein